MNMDRSQFLTIKLQNVWKCSWWAAYTFVSTSLWTVNLCWLLVPSFHNPHPSMTQIPVAEPRHNAVYCVNGCTSSDVLPVSFKIAKQQVPIFKAKCSSWSMRNLNIDYIKLRLPFQRGMMKPEFRLQRQCQGHEESINNSSHGQLSKKNQIEFEAVVLSVTRDFSNEIGDATSTVKRLFLQGLPEWIRALVVSGEDRPLPQLVYVFPLCNIHGCVGCPYQSIGQ